MEKKITELKLHEIKDVAGGATYATMVAYSAPTYSTMLKSPTYTSPTLSTSSSLLIK